ncbi:MAG: DUF2493 domain-containing protein, partial [Proteobacteria bacterium]|nr:DUF2493 domain-containing protein [Pseudomonadota bacterium]
ALHQGGASGIDTWARHWAGDRGIPVATWDANWAFYKRAAGPKRNGWMLDIARPDVVLAFPGNDGTADCVRQAHARALVVVKVDGAGKMRREEQP